MRNAFSWHAIRNKRVAGGLTLIRLLFLLAIAGIAGMWLVVTLQNAMHHNHPPEIKAAYRDMGEIGEGLVRYHKANGVYPTEQQGLLALALRPTRAPIPQNWQTGGYVKRLPRDPWGVSYSYHVINDKQVEIFTYVPADAEAGTEEQRIAKTIP
jgi:general secretion pathway protein G